MATNNVNQIPKIVLHYVLNVLALHRCGLT